MIKFFRKIRQRMLNESKFSKYLIYAIGEIVLVMIGILLALQVNNWNQIRKEHKQEVKLYENLLESLRADSADLVRIQGILDNGLSAQRFIIGSSLQDLIDDHTIEALGDSIDHCTYVGTSFFPRDGAYKEITNNGYLALIRSEEIKSQLADLYDRQYSRYKHIDASIDKKSELHLEPIVRADFQILFYASGVQSSEEFDHERLKIHFPAFKRECISIFTTSLFAQDALARCYEGVNELLTLLRAELNDSKQ